MKKLATLVFSFLLIGITAKANNQSSEDCVINRYDGKTYIFEEGGVEFSVFADGQFDFAYVGQNHGSDVQVNVNTPNVDISFNSGHDYEMYVQYDDYGAVVQIENVPIYYDGYGRIIQAGDVDIRYNNRRIVRVGGLYVNYNNYGNYINCTGFINSYNQFYVYRPWHVFYTRPIFSSCIVYDYQYRRHYSPVRYSFSHHRTYYRNGHRSNYRNGRRDFYRPGSRVHYKNGRTAQNRDYRANRRNTMVSKHGRRGNNSTIAKRSNRKDRGTVNKGRPANSNVTKGRPITSRSDAKRSTRKSTVTKGRPVTSSGTVNRGDRKKTVNKGRPVTKRSSSKKVNRTTRPQKKTSRVAQNNGNKKVNRSTTSRPSTKRVAKRTTSRSNTSSTRGGNSKSRAASKRGRGL